MDQSDQEAIKLGEDFADELVSNLAQFFKSKNMLKNASLEPDAQTMSISMSMMQKMALTRSLTYFYLKTLEGFDMNMKMVVPYIQQMMMSVYDD